MKSEGGRCTGEGGRDGGEVEQQLASVWPQCSSHLQRWIFSPQQLHAMRSLTHAEACATVKQLRMQRNSHVHSSSGDAVVATTAGAGQPEKKKKKKKRKEEEEVAPLPRLKEVLQLIEYFALQLLIICRRKNLFRPNVVECACIFFHRFWCRRSPLQYDVRLLLLACLLLALKAEDLARHYTLGDLLGDIEGLDVAAVLRLELPLCEAIDFDVYVLHSRPPLLAIIHGVNALAAGAAASLSSSWGGSGAAAACSLGCGAAACREVGAASDKPAAASASPSPPAAPTRGGGGGAVAAVSQEDEAVHEQEEKKPLILRQQRQQQPQQQQATEYDADWLQSTAATVAATGTAAGALLPSLRLLLERSEQECTLMFVAQDLPLLYPPAILAVAAVVAAARSPPCSKELAAAAVDVEALLKKVLAAGQTAAHLRRCSSSNSSNTNSGSTNSGSTNSGSSSSGSSSSGSSSSSNSDSSRSWTTSGAAAAVQDRIGLPPQPCKQEVRVKKEESESATTPSGVAGAASVALPVSSPSFAVSPAACSSSAAGVAGGLSADASTAPAPGPLGAPAVANSLSQPTEEEEAFWRHVLQPQVQHILQRLQEVKELQQRVQNQQIGEEMELLLDACIEAVEEQQQATPSQQPLREGNGEAHATGKRSWGKQQQGRCC